MKRTLLGGCVVWMASLAIAGEVDVPNQFQAGTPAVAAEVNANFAAVEAAIDDNAQAIEANTQAVTDLDTGLQAAQADIDTNAQDTAALQEGLGTAGVAVRVDGVVIGRYLGNGSGSVEVDLAASVGIGTVQVAEGVSLGNASRLGVVSSAGYRFTIATSDFEHPRLSEGQLDLGPVFYDGVDCTGSTYFPVEGDTGIFSTFELGDGGIRPAKRWALRQGVVYASLDLMDSISVYMIRRGQSVQTVALRSILVWADVLEQPFCVDMANIPGFDINNPLDVNHTVFAVEPLDPIEAGVSGTLGGEITVGL